MEIPATVGRNVAVVLNKQGVSTFVSLGFRSIVLPPNPDCRCTVFWSNAFSQIPLRLKSALLVFDTSLVVLCLYPPTPNMTELGLKEDLSSLRHSRDTKTTYTPSDGLLSWPDRN